MCLNKLEKQEYSQLLELNGILFQDLSRPELLGYHSIE